MKTTFMTGFKIHTVLYCDSVLVFTFMVHSQ